MNNHGSSIILLIFEVLVVLLVVAMTFSIANAYAGSTLITKISYAEELEMMVNALVSVPGDALVEFPYNVSGYVVLFDPAQEIIVRLESETNDMGQKRRVYLPEGFTMAGVSREERLCIEKQQQSIRLVKCREESAI